MIRDDLHLRAPGNWLNDPNGFIYYKGEYHLFYQHFPYAPRWGTMHWGHAVSPDLVHWKHLGVALFPTKDYDQNGVFSGTALEADGALRLYYSAVRYLQTDGEDIHLAAGDRFETSQALVTSPDGRHFDNWGDKRQVLPVLTDPALGDRKDTRDPRVWRDGRGYCMLLGSTRDGTGRVLFYRSGDGLRWTYANQFASPALGRILECPDLFPLGEGWLFLGSPMWSTDDGLTYPHQAMYARADFDPETCRLSLAGPMTFLDWGLDLYAPQTALDREGRRVLIGWMRMPGPVTDAPDGRGPWNGMMSLPRLVELRGDRVCFPVHPNVAAAFRRPAADLSPLAEYRPVRVRTALREGEALDLGGYRVSLEGGRIIGDRSRVFDGPAGHRLTAATPALGEGGCDLDIFLDPHLVEIFVNGGQYVLSHVVHGLGSGLTGPRCDPSTL